MRHLPILFLVLFVSLVLHLTTDHAYSYRPSYPCYFYLSDFPKLVWAPGETITITATHCEESSADEATLIIADGLANLNPGSDIREQYEQGKNILYKETKQAVNGTVAFEYTIPESSETYRYFVSITPGQMGGSDDAFFYTKEGAEKIAISDVNLFNPQVRQGEQLRFEVFVTDGLGNPLPFVRLDVESEYQGCDGPVTLRSSLSTSNLGEHETSEYYKRGVLWGWLSVREGTPGAYQMTIDASTGGFLDHSEARAQKEGIEFEVLDDTSVRDELVIMAHNDLLYSGTLAITSDPNDRHIVELEKGGEFPLTVQAIRSGCTSTSDDMVVKAEILRTEMNGAKEIPLTSRHFGSTLSCYANPELCSFEPIDSVELEGRPEGYLAFGHEFTGQITKEAGEYVLNVSAQVDDQTLENSIGIRVHERYVHEYRGPETFSSIVIDSWFSKVEDVEFDIENKKITITADRSVGPKVLDVFIPYELLDGDITVFVDDEPVIHDNKVQGDSYYKKEDERLHLTLFPRAEKTTIEITGTSAVPEFGTITAMVLAVSIFAALAYGRFSRFSGGLTKQI